MNPNKEHDEPKRLEAKIEKVLPIRLKLLSESTEPTGIISNTER